jgi:hypothetical protein
MVQKSDASVRITSTPGKHVPAAVEKFLPDVMGSVLEFQSTSERTALRLYITGDTIIFDDLHEIPRRYPEIDLALFHIGGTQIMGMLLTMDAEQGVEAIRISILTRSFRSTTTTMTSSSRPLRILRRR